MTKPDLLEVTITHNLSDSDEVAQLYERHLIALDWDRKGAEPSEYHGRARTDIKLFHEIVRCGAAVIASYNGATERRSDRLIGWVAPGTPWTRVNGLLCLQLSSVKRVDSSKSFLGNLAPRSCTVQTCHNRARGRLARLVSEREAIRSVWSLHNFDVEWLVTNFLLIEAICTTVWSGSRSYESIDHAGFGLDPVPWTI